MSDEKKSGFLDKLKGLVDKGREASRPQTGALAPRPRPQTQPLGTPADQFTGRPPAERAAQTGPLSPEPAVSEAELSPKRLAMIDDFMTGQARIAQMNDPTYMYKLVTDERSHQVRTLGTLKERLADAAPGSSQAAELQAQIQRTQAIIQNLFRVLKHITGKKGHTGGTGFF